MVVDIPLVTGSPSLAVTSWAVASLATTSLATASLAATSLAAIVNIEASG